MLIHSLVPHRDPRRAGAVVPSLFDEFLRAAGPVSSASPGGFVPQVDVIESTEAIRFVAELPGVADGKFQVIVDSDVLTLKGEKQVVRSEEDAGLHRSERSSGAFSRSFRLPFDVDPDSVTAALAHGVLEITVPKPVHDKPRTIPITTG